MAAQKEWFKTWFNSPYYHILYDQRNEEEANKFILKLKDYLHLSSEDKILDLACGAGRHAAFLSKYVGESIGVDLSENSIQQAQKTYIADNLEFYKHDMRLPFRINYFDYIFNFFTSFGYFKKEADNLKVLQSINKGLKKGGYVLIDFLNATKVKNDLVEREQINKHGIEFYIRREIVNDKIIKHIKFDAEEKVFSFTEVLQALTKNDFHRLLTQAGFEVKAEFGGYELEDFNENISNRYIVLARKKQ